MATVVTVTLDQLPGWINAKAKAFADPRALQPLYKQLQVLAVSDTRDNFLGSQDPDGSPWAALASRAGKPLMDKGILRGSIQSTVTSNGLSMWTNVDYAPIHQHGGVVSLPEIKPTKARALRWVAGGVTRFAKRVKAHLVRIPQRRFLGFGRRFMAKAVPVIDDYIRRKMEAA